MEQLSSTLASKGIENAVMLGHSQGGIITQAYLQDVLPARPEQLVGAILLGTFPLGHLPPLSPSMWDTLGWMTGYPYFVATGQP